MQSLNQGEKNASQQGFYLCAVSSLEPDWKPRAVSKRRSYAELQRDYTVEAIESPPIRKSVCIRGGEQTSEQPVTRYSLSTFMLSKLGNRRETDKAPDCIRKSKRLGFDEILRLITDGLRELMPLLLRLNGIQVTVASRCLI